MKHGIYGQSSVSKDRVRVTVRGLSIGPEVYPSEAETVAYFLSRLNPVAREMLAAALASDHDRDGA